MANLLASLTTAAGSMKAYEQALSVVQNNVTNATTPGYARQQADLVALAFQPNLEIPGGVEFHGSLSSRSTFSERAVWRQAERHGRLAQLAAGLAQIEPVFDISEDAGIASAMDKLYSSFSQLSVTPNDTPARENVLRQAGRVAQAFNQSAKSLGLAAEHARRETRSLVDQINELGGQIREMNVEFRRDYREQHDAGLKARLYTALEELSQLADINVLQESDGSVTVLLGGQTPLVIGDQNFRIQAELSGTRSEILDANGNVITGQIQQGELKGVLELANDRIPSYTADLNRLAAAFADGINSQLAAGVDQSGLPPPNNLFQYDDGVGAASSLSVTGITADQIAAASPDAPGGNANALKLAALTTTPMIDGFTYTEYYGQLSAHVGQDIASAQQGEHTHALLLAQARNLRDQTSAVNLDEEAALLLQYQQAYRASARLVQVINGMMDVVMGMLK